jgi:hypothetical protein
MRVLESLGAVLRVKASELEEAGMFEGPAAGGPVYARSYDVHELAADHLAGPAAPASPGDWDEVDELFRGGR